MGKNNKYLPRTFYITHSQTFRAEIHTSITKTSFSFHKISFPCFVGPCHHGMARPQVADEGTASDMEGSCEYIE